MPTTELSLPNDMSATLQKVQDEQGTSSALQISTNAVQIEPPAGAPQAHSLTVKAPVSTGTGPSVLLHSLSNESAIRFTATDNPLNDKSIHIGIGGNAGSGNFFVFTTDAGVVFKVLQNGDVRVEKNLSIGGQLALPNVPPATTVLKHLMIDPVTGKLFMQ